ncbi:MAG: hypothetical protein AAF434_12690 [Pseudomonadota bacterium]
MPLFTFRSIRIYILLGFLLFSVIYTVHQLLYSRSWHNPLNVVIYPINADGKNTTARYVDTLSVDHFRGIEKWFAREGKRYKLLIERPIAISLGSEIESLPPELPRYRNAVFNMMWGVHLRWWAFRHSPDDGSNLSRVRVFVLYHSAVDKPLPHSLGLQKGLIGLVNAFAVPRQNKQNNVVIAHEVLHTVGALDKYAPGGYPIYPDGYANPNRKPLHPQRSAEIMAGRIPIGNGMLMMPRSLRSTVINEQTAREINWVK